jgi:hypothetical protein
MPSNAAAAIAAGNNGQIPSSVTIPLEGLTLKAGQFIELTDTTPVLVTAAHATINVLATRAIIMIQNLILQW